MPYDSEYSLLSTKISIGMGGLSPENIDIINQWINEGALPEELTDTCDADLGDVNGDGMLNVLDVVLLAQFVLGSNYTKYHVTYNLIVV